MFGLLLFALAGSAGMAADARSLLEQARTALQRNHLDDAARAATEAIRLDPALGDAEMILGLVATAGKDLDSAEKHFLRAVALQPSNPLAHSYLGATYLARQRLTDAHSEFSKVLDIDKSNSAAQYNLGVIAAMQRKPELAIQYFDSAVRSNPGDIAALGALLQAQLALRRSSDARDTAARLQSVLPVGDSRLLEAGALLASSGDYAGAIPIFERAYRANPQSVDPAYNLALALFRSGDPDRAIRVLQPFGRSAQALNLLGSIQENRGRYAEGLEVLAAAAKLQPENEDYRVDHAALLMREADIAPALQAFADAAHDFPKSLRVRLGLGSAYYLAGKYDEAASTLLDALQINASAPVVYQLLARVYESAPKHHGPIQRVFREYLSRQPNDAAAYSGYGTILLSAARSSPQADLSEASSYLEKALAIDPKLSEAHLQLGIIAQDKGDLERAIQCFTSAVEFAPASAQAHYRLANALAKAGDSARSRAEMQLFRQLRSKEQERDKDFVARSLARVERP